MGACPYSRYSLVHTANRSAFGTFPKLTPMVVDGNATVMNTNPNSKRSRTTTNENEDSGEENSDGVASSSRAKKKKKKKAPANSTTTANATDAKATATVDATDDTSVDAKKQQNHQPPSTPFVYPLPKKNGSPGIRTDSNRNSSSSSGSSNGSSSTTTTESNQLMDGGGNSRLRIMEEEGRGLTTTATATTQQHQQPRQPVRPLPTHNEAAAVAATTGTTATAMPNTMQEVGVTETTTTTPTVAVALLPSQVSSSSSMTFTGNPRVFMRTCVLVCIVLVATVSIMMMPPTFQHIKGTTFAPLLADDDPTMHTNTKTTCHVWELTANEIMPRTMTTTLTASKNTDTPPPSFSLAGLFSSPIRQCCCVCAFFSVVVFLVSEWTHNYSQTDKLYVLQLQL